MLQKAYDYFFSTLSNQTRLSIIDFLRKSGPTRATDIAKELGINQTTTSHALARLEACGFVVASPNGKERIYRMREETMPLLDLLEKHTERFCKLCVRGLK
ncbi:winged helix-turn-helix transcriptional regulator [archaeon]|nr:winged helix-turn-helix transcriptional regulator [archaeon]